ncbi:hypothetical protein K788_0003143 [Paraburkholderia caribensis MBA4]|uniref:Uncharacterized protein n=1 Tax=Paraburkholderia caribensis MBA4 TaxID=1323664 RepID=A0A0P0RF81_9BURK|nr:hypothetical protein [Paraburkholderia caribensis]ALL66912.1 hypothetical protein K788_0003143 [Paraburkholderia caribensis MBA4]
MSYLAGWVGGHLAGNRWSGSPRAIPSEAESEFHIVRFALGFSVALFLGLENMFYMAKNVAYLIEK